MLSEYEDGHDNDHHFDHGDADVHVDDDHDHAGRLRLLSFQAGDWKHVAEISGLCLADSNQWFPLRMMMMMMMNITIIIIIIIMVIIVFIINDWLCLADDHDDDDDHHHGHG